MYYDRSKSEVMDILEAANMANTINGGMTEPKVSITNQVDHYLLTAKVPGVDVAELHVEIADRKVIVHHKVRFEKQHEVVEMPHIIAAFPITPGIDYKNITANRVGDSLEVILPFNELANGYTRHVDINL